MNSARALEIATEAHEGQVRWGGQPYITHPMAVRDLIREFDGDDELESIALLHDVVEDSKWTLEDLRKEGFSERVVEGVDCLTKVKGESYDQSLTRVAGNYDAILVKQADLIHNLSDLKEGARRDKYLVALLFLRSVVRFIEVNSFLNTK